MDLSIQTRMAAFRVGWALPTLAPARALTHYGLPRVPSNLAMQLQITTSHHPATDMGYW